MPRFVFVILAGLAMTFAGQGTGLAQAPSTPVPAGEPNAFGERVRAYLLANPEVVIEAAQLYQQKQQAAQAEAVKRTIKSKADELLRDPADPVAGDETGDVTVVEFFDYNCKYCRAVAPTVAELLASDPRLRLVHKEFPILGEGSAAAARVALAAARQDTAKYRELHRALMGASRSVDGESALKAAAELGLNADRLRRDMADPAIAASIARNQALAAELGINGTPAFVIGDQVVPGAAERAALEDLVREARGQAGATSP